MFTAVFIRDFPDFPIGWRGSYCHKFNEHLNYDLVYLQTISEIRNRGGKYGAILYKDDVEYKKFNQKGEEI